MAMVKKQLAVLLILLIGLAAGCANNASPKEISQDVANAVTNQSVPTKAKGGQQPVNGQDTMRLTVYYATNDGMNVAPEDYIVPQNDHPAQTAVELLLAGPKKPGLTSVVPLGTKLRQVLVKDQIAYVDFNDKLIKNNTGGSTSEMLLVATIVNTLTEFPDIQRVRILVEGKKIDTISGHMDISEPLSRFEKMIKK